MIIVKLKCILFFEVLSDPEKKAKYDRHGEVQMNHTVYPPEVQQFDPEK